MPGSGLISPSWQRRRRDSTASLNRYDPSLRPREGGRYKEGSRSGFVTETPRYDTRNDLVTTRYDLVTTLRGVTERS